MLKTQIIILSIALAAQWANGGEDGSAPDFGRYPHTPVFSNIVAGHTNLAAQASIILSISSFVENDLYANKYLVFDKYVVIQSGMASACRVFFDDPEGSMASQRGWRSKQLLKPSLEALGTAMNELPRQSQVPPIGRLVIVSFRDGTNWITRTYDGQQLPKALRNICDIVRDRSVTEKKRQ